MVFAKKARKFSILTLCLIICAFVGVPVVWAITRQDIRIRAQTWVDAQIPYNQSAYHDGYRTDCSGFVSYAWNLRDSDGEPMSLVTWTLDDVSTSISKDDLQSGDILLNPTCQGGHVAIFDHWANSERTIYWAYDMNGTDGVPVYKEIPYPYWPLGCNYSPYRYNGIIKDSPGVTLFDLPDLNGDGSFLRFESMTVQNSLPDWMDNKASSVQIPYPWSASLYTEPNLEGECIYLDESNTDLSHIGFNDNISSIEVFYGVCPLNPCQGSQTSRSSASSTSGVCDPSPSPPVQNDGATFTFNESPDDNYIATPGETVHKTWWMRNSGSTTWSSGYEWVRIDGEQMGSPASIPAPSAAPGDVVDISVDFVVPSSPGDHYSHWRMRNAQGTFFGDEVYVQINIGDNTLPPSSSDIDLDCVNNTCYATVAPGQTFRPTIRATVNSGQLQESRGDMLRHKDGDLFGAWPHVAVQGTVNTGQSYDFTFYADNPIHAPSQEGTYESKWQVWRDGNWAGEEFMLRFTVSQSGGSNRPPNQPALASPHDWTVYYSGNTATLCAQANGDPDGDSITSYYFDVYDSAQLWNSSWTANNCVTTGALGPYGYQWRVKVRDSRGAESEWSDTWHFTLVNPNLTITQLYFESLDGQSEQVRVRACTDGQGGVGITMRVSVNTANDGSENGEWRGIGELGVPCFNETDAPVWTTLEYEGGPHLVRVEAHGSSTGWNGATVRQETFTVPSDHRANSPVILPNLDERYFNSPMIHLDSVTSLRTTSYQIVASTNSDYSNPLIDEPITYSATGYTYTLDAEYARIYWRITATGPYGSNTSSFETHVDMTPPNSQISALPPVTTDAKFTLNWSGSDARAGLRWYHIQMRDVSRPDSAWEDWLVNTTKTAEMFQGQPGHTYAFRVRAMDNIGNWELWPADADLGDTHTQVDPSAAPPTAWWDANYTHKRNLLILNNDSDTVPAGFPVHIHFDNSTTPTASEIYNASLAVTKGDDVRVIYDNQTEISRFIQHFAADQIDLWFPVQAGIGGEQTDSSTYQLYYGYAGASSPPAEVNAVFLPPADTNTMGLWHFQEGTGSSVADSSGRNHHGNFFSAGWGAGFLGNTGVFNGTSAYVDIPHSDDFKPGAITLEAWIYTTALPYTVRIFAKSRYEFRIHHDRNLQFVINAAGGDRTITGQAKIYDNQWYHVAATYDGGTRMRLYVNGVLDKEENFGAPPEYWNDHPLIIGREANNGPNYFHGYIQHARVSNVARTDFSYGRITVSPSVAAGLQLDPEVTGTPDLAVLNLTTYPNSGGGLLVLAQVENQGSASTQNNFYTDLYMNHMPTGTGDYDGSLKFWVNSPIAASAQVTLTTVVTELGSVSGYLSCALATPGSEITATLYTQVDSVGVISETDNANNISSGVEICLASADAYEGDDDVANATLATLGRAQRHNFDSLADTDWVKFQAQGGVTYTLSTSNLGTGADTYLYLYDTDGGTLLAANDDYDGSLASHIEWVAPVTGTYYLLVQHWNPNVSGCGTAYTLNVRESAINTIYLPIILRNYNSSVAPAAPSDLQAVALSSSEIRLTWQDNASNETAFGIDLDGDTTVVAANTTTYTFEELEAETEYCYRVYAYNSFGDSDWSNWACVTTLAAEQWDFQEVFSYTLGEYWNENNIAVADFDQDDATDVVLMATKSDQASKVVLLHNQGNWQFTDTILFEYPANHYGYEVQTADLNNDGWPDLVLREGGVTHAFLNDQVGGFNEVWTTDGAYGGLDLSDVNNDTFVDILAGYQSGAGGIVKVFLNNGAGTTFSQTWESPLYGGENGTVDRVFAVELDNDNVPDLVATEIYSGLLMTFAGMDTGTTFTETTRLDLGDSVFSLATGDVNGDDWTDFATYVGWGQARVFLAQGDGSVTEYWQSPDLGEGAQNLALGDMNHDGYDDLFIGTFSDGGLRVYKNIAGSEFELVWQDSLAGNGYAGTVADLDGDEYPDLIVGEKDDNDQSTIRFLRNQLLLPSGQATIYDGFTYYGESGFSFGTNTVVAWNSSVRDLLAAKTGSPASMHFFLPYDTPPYSDGDNARAGIIEMSQTDLDQVSECPESGYQYHWAEASLGGVYCVRTSDGGHYAVIQVTAIDDSSLSFMWVYQPDGSRLFD